MEDKQLLKGSVGSCNYEIDVQTNNVVAKVSFDGAADVQLTIYSKAGLEILKKLIPGQIDDAIISVVEAALAL